MFEKSVKTPVVKIDDDLFETLGVELYIKREDLIDPIISGNKFRKLKYNLINAKNEGHGVLLTFGGAYSNHIHALAYAGFKFGFKTIGVIRGDERLPLNPTLAQVADFGMEFLYISREAYRNKGQAEVKEMLHRLFGDFLLIPEGGSNALAVKGCTEILSDSDMDFDHVCCACGTGGTIAGIIASLNGSKNILGFNALKGGEFLKRDITNLLSAYGSPLYPNWDLICEYHFGGYAKYNQELIDFMNTFKENHQIQLDPIYTGKMLFGIYDLAKKGFFEPGNKILAIHTGGLQGIRGFNERFGSLIK